MVALFSRVDLAEWLIADRIRDDNWLVELFGARNLYSAVGCLVPMQLLTYYSCRTLCLVQPDFTSSLVMN